VASGSVLSGSRLTVNCASIVACMGHSGLDTRGDPVSTGVSYDSRRVWDTTNFLGRPTGSPLSRRRSAARTACSRRRSAYIPLMTATIRTKALPIAEDVSKSSVIETNSVCKLPHPTPSALRASVLEGGATGRASLCQGLERRRLSVALMWTPGNQSPAICQ